MSRAPRSAPANHSDPRRGRSRRGRLGAFLRTGSTTGRLPAFLLSVGLAVLVAGFLTSSDFVVRTVVVRGNDVAFADSIVAASGALGQPIFELDTDAVARQVAAHPAVESVTISATFPDRIVVEVRERAPIVVWQAGDRAVLVDRYGWVIADGFVDHLPRVVQREGELPALGGRFEPELVQAVVYVTERIGGRLLSLEYDRVSGLIAFLESGRIAVLGGADRIPLKLNVLDSASSLPVQWTRLDVREPDRPYYQ